jgi:hypothetical protein
MSGRVLAFKDYIGGMDNVIVEEMVPSKQKTYRYNFGVDISNYSFELSSQTIVVDVLSYDRLTGDPSFSDSSVLGSFANVDFGSGNVNVVSSGDGTVDITIPAQRYTGQIIPDARTNVPITVISVKWTDTTTTPSQTDSHRWAILERYEPDVTIGNPTLDAGFTAIPTS